MASQIIGDGNTNFLLGTTHDDEIFGLDKDDTLQGGLGADYLDGGQGFDFASYRDAEGPVTVDLLNPSLNGGEARGDKFISIEGILGSRHDDFLFGDNAANIIVGEGGNDTINARGGSDVVREQGGNDTIEGGTDSFNAALPAIQRTDLGDVLEYAGDPNVRKGIIADLTNNRVAELSFGTSDTVSGFEGIRGTAFDDEITGSNNSDSILDGREGNDTIRGLRGNDALRGGDGNDSLDGGLHNDWVRGDAGNDTVFGGSGTGADVVDGGAGDDTVDGGDGNDTVIGGAGADAVDGGFGTDTVSYAYVTQAASLGMGVVVGLVDAVDESDNLAGTAYVSTGPGSNLSANGTTDVDTLRRIEDVIGTRFNDIIVGNQSNNVLDGGDGDDYLDGAAGLNTLIGGKGNDTFQAFDGTNHMVGGNGIDTVLYASDNGMVINLTDPSLNTDEAAGDTYETVENVVINANLGDDTVTGNAADNMISPGGGNDTLYGLEGADTFRIAYRGADHADGGLGVDTVDYLSGSQSADTMVLDLIDQMLNSGAAAGDTFFSIENVRGTIGNDTINGGVWSNLLEGNGGDDVIRGRGGHDTIIGGEGNDTAVYGEGAKEYTFSSGFFQGQAYLMVTDKDGSEGTDMLIGIENLLFNGQLFSASDFMV
jgi:Ca2+-binding RTX toxin-like protein